MQKRVITIQDISCIGRCSLTVALPIISAAGIECSILPTAILSTHTGGFTGYTFRDLTSDVQPICDHWKTLGIRVDALYTGYLGSNEQLELMSRMFDDFRQPGTLVMVDPAMADGGKLYPAFDMDFALGMRDLCKKADIIVPNLTEAAFMLQEPFIADGYDQTYIEDLMVKLAALGPRTVVLTGVSFEPGKLGAAAYDATTGEFFYAFAQQIEGYYHGTGDVFSSTILAALLRDKRLDQAIRIAVDYTVACIQRTHDAGCDIRYGVNFEEEIPALVAALA